MQRTGLVGKSQLLLQRVIITASLGWPGAVFVPQPGVGGEMRDIDHVIQISVDGLQANLLEELMSSDPDRYPNFLRLQNEGASTFNARTDYTHSVTVPNHTSMITGRPVSQPDGMPDTVQHGVGINFPDNDATIHSDGNPNVEYIHSVFDVAHDHGLSTGFFATKNRLGILSRSYEEGQGAPDVLGPDNGTDKIDVTVIHEQDSAAMLLEFTDYMESGPLNFSFMHITDPDTAGHAHGWGSEAWDDSVADVDTYLGQIFEVIDDTPSLQGATAIVLTADHGGGEPVTSHIDPTFAVNYTIPLFLWEEGLPDGSDLYDQFSNRVDPFETRPDYVALDQPLRNGDTGNIALALLGLGPVPGSLMRPAFDGTAPGDPLDFDNDGLFTVDDLDALTAAIGAQSTNLEFDLDGNLSVDALDLQEWLTGAAHKHGLHVPYAPGDTNLDGIVDDADMAVLLGNLFTVSTRWSAGNINTDGVVDVYDFNVMLNNTTPPADTAAVSEPASGIGTLAILLVGLRRKRRLANGFAHSGA